jgi:hypothetical protein
MTAILLSVAAAWLVMSGVAGFVIGRGIRIADDRLAATLEPARNAPAGTWVA